MIRDEQGRPVLAWHSNPEVKLAQVNRMMRHRAQDTFIQGMYYVKSRGRYRGCFHGCLTADAVAAELKLSRAELAEQGDARGGIDWLAEGQRLWGIPADLGALIDTLFEDICGDGRTEVADDWAGNLAAVKAARQAAGDWAVAVTQAIPVGADLSGVEAAWHAAGNRPGSDPWQLMVELLAAAPLPLDEPTGAPS